MSVGENLWDCGVCWSKSGIVSASGKRCVLNLTNIKEASTFVRDIWLRPQLGGTNHGAGVGAAAEGRKD